MSEEPKSPRGGGGNLLGVFPSPRASASSLSKHPHPNTVQSIYEVLSPKPEDFLNQKRIFLKGGDIYVWKDAKKRKSPRRLLLFNDTILVVKDSKTFLKDRKYVLKTYISIQSSLKTVATSTTPETFEFSIIAVQKSFVFFANNEEERQEWIVELKAAISMCAAMGLCEKSSKDKEWKTVSSSFFGKVLDTLEFEFGKPSPTTAKKNTEDAQSIQKRLSMPTLSTADAIVSGQQPSESGSVRNETLRHSTDSLSNNLGAELLIKTNEGYAAPLAVTKTIEPEVPTIQHTAPETAVSPPKMLTRERSNSRIAPVRQESLRMLLAARQSKEQLSSTNILQKQLSINEEELLRENRELKKESTKWRMEYGLLFKELDAVHRRTRRKTSKKEPLSKKTKFKLNLEICSTEKLDEFLATFFLYYPQVKDGKTLVDHDGNELKVKQQFARDVPCMVRLNGANIEASNDFDKVKLVMQEIERVERAANKAGIDLKGLVLRDLIPELANQTLCLILFEKLLAYYQPKEMMIKQDWLHYIDITLNAKRKQLGIYAMAVFQIVNLEDDTFPVMYVKSMCDINIIERDVRFDFSMPVFEATQLVL